MNKKFKKPYFLRGFTKPVFYGGKNLNSLQKILRGLRFWIKFAKSLVLKYRLRLALFVLSFVVLGLVVRNLIPKLPIFSNNLIIGVVGDYKLDNLPQSLTLLYSSGLTKFDKTGKVQPNLANTWETQDGKKFKFVLKDNLFWQDGKKLTVVDIQSQIPNVQVKVLDEKTLELTLTDTYSPYPATLAKPVFRQKSKVGTGTYKLAKIIKTGEGLKQISLVPVKDNLPQITIRFFPNSQTATDAFKAGRVGMLFNLMRLNGLENWKGAEITKTLDSLRVVAVFYNTKDEFLSNTKLRKALDLAIDRSGFPNIASGPYPPTSWVNLEVKPVFDLKKAAEIVKSEKITDAKLIIQTPSIFENLTQNIAKNWQNLGFEVEIGQIDKIPTNFQVAIFGLEIPADPDQYSFWHSTQSQHLTKIEDPKLDKILEDGRRLIEPDERKAKYQELQRELKELVPASFLFFPDRYIVVNKNTKDKLDQIKKLFPEFPVN